jgi:hypothetical protein
MQDEEDLRGKDELSNKPALSSALLWMSILLEPSITMGEGIMNPGLLLSQLMQELD